MSNRHTGRCVGFLLLRIKMPKKSLKTCLHPGCVALTTSGYCDQHQAPSFVRDEDRQRLYGTARWQRIRKRQLAREPWCIACLKIGLYTPATEVDHVVPHGGDVALFFSGPFQSMCKSCHSRKTAEEIRERGAAKKFSARESGARGFLPVRNIPRSTPINGEGGEDAG